MKKKLTIFILISMLISLQIGVSTTYAAQSFTPCPLRGQEKRNWCWAASTQMLLESKKYYKNQSQIVSYIYGSAVDRPASSQSVKQAAQWGSGGSLQFDVNYNALPFSGSGSVVSSINNGWSIAAGCIPTSQYATGHMMVITGYDTGNNNIWLQDPQGKSSWTPAQGYETWCNYSALVNGSLNQTQFYYLNHKWVESIN